MSVFGGRILLTTDGSPEAESALGTAAMVLEKLGAGLSVVGSWGGAVLVARSEEEGSQTG